MRRNPPSYGFNYLSEGATARVYTNNERVEYLVSAYSPKAGVSDSDLSREIVIFAKELLPIKYSKHLPEITRDRIDESQDYERGYDIVYSMDFIEDLENKPRMNKEDFKVIVDTLYSIAFLLFSYLGYNTYTQFIYQEDDLCPAGGLDISLNKARNWSTQNGVEIARDPIFFYANGDDVIRIFNLGKSGKLRFYYEGGKIVLDDGNVRVSNFDEVLSKMIKVYTTTAPNNIYDVINLPKVRWNFTNQTDIARYLKGCLL